MISLIWMTGENERYEIMMVGPTNKIFFLKGKRKWMKRGLRFLIFYIVFELCIYQNMGIWRNLHRYGI